MNEASGAAKIKSAQVRVEGNAAFKKGRWQQSIELYTRAAELDPLDPIALCNRAQSYLRLEQYANAEDDCTRALGLDANSLKALYRRALALRGLERVEEAIKDLQSLLVLDPENQQASAELDELIHLQPQQTTNPAVGLEVQSASSSFADLRKSRQANKATYVQSNEASNQPPPPSPPQNPSSIDGGAGIQLLRKLSQLPASQGWSYLAYYPPSNIPIMLRDLLDPEALGRLLLALEVGSRSQPLPVRAIMEGLRRTPRFQMNSLMLSNAEREAATRAWSSCGGEGIW